MTTSLEVRLGGVGAKGNCLKEGSIVRGDFALAKMGDGSWIPVHKVFLDQAVDAVPDLLKYMQRVFVRCSSSYARCPAGEAAEGG